MLVDDGDLVVVTRIAAKRRQRVEIQQSSRLRADLGWRNHVAGEGQSRCRIEDLHRLPQRIQSLGEISAALRRIRHQSRLRGVVNVARPLVSDEEVRAVPEEMRNLQRAAQRCHARDAVVGGLGVFWPLREKGRASNAELSKMTPSPPLYSPLAPLRLLPKANDCAKGEAAPFITLPLIRKPSAARWLSVFGRGGSVVRSAGLVARHWLVPG